MEKVCGKQVPHAQAGSEVGMEGIQAKQWEKSILAALMQGFFPLPTPLQGGELVASPLLQAYIMLWYGFCHVSFTLSEVPQIFQYFLKQCQLHRWQLHILLHGKVLVVWLAALGKGMQLVRHKTQTQMMAWLFCAVHEGEGS